MRSQQGRQDASGQIKSGSFIGLSRHDRDESRPMAMTGSAVRRRLWRTALLLFALLIPPQSPLMAMPAAMPHAGPHMQHTLGGAAHRVAMKHAGHHRGQSHHCPQCGTCGTCYSAVVSMMSPALHFTAPPPAAPSPASPTEVYLPPDPFPPRN
jgi:hypothetical protein